MAFTAKDVAALRERTNCGMMDCKKALVASDGDMDKAIEYLREKGLAASIKKAGRIAAEGVVFSVVKGNIGVVVEVNAETDFVAKNETFQAFVKDVAEIILEKNPADVEALLACDGKDGLTVEKMVQEKVLTIGENIKIRRFVRMEGDLISYVHAGGKIGVLIKFDTDVAGKDGFVDYAKDVAMQIAAMNPTYVRKEEVPADAVEHEKEILIAQIKEDPKMANKPQNILENMVIGRLNKKFYQDACLLEQPFVKDGNLSVAKYTQETAKTLGGKIDVVTFVRFEKGEGIEKKQENFAEEIAKQLGK
ncbi:MAG: elongation factor Ts [Oscillospiraceae bacterium]|nr:elongation factor Ts [Oscillospiraceae bacterium]